MFGKRLTEAREKAGLSRKDLADKLDVGQNTIWRWEAGERQPSIEKIQAIARVLGVTTDELMTTSTPENKNALAETKPGEGANDKQIDMTEDRIEKPANAGTGGTLKVPVYEDFEGVCAGQGTFNYEGIIRDELEIPLSMIGGSYSKEPGREPYIITIRGDSMVEADVPDGAQVLVNPILEANDGDTIIAEYFDDWMIKWVYWDRSGGGELRSSSTKYPVRRFTREDVNNGNFVYKGKVCWVLNPPRRGA